MKNLMNRLKKLRDDSDKSQDEMAELLGISQSAYSRLESNPGSATLKQIYQLAEIHGVSVGFLLDIDAEQLKYYHFYKSVKKMTDET